MHGRRSGPSGPPPRLLLLMAIVLRAAGARASCNIIPPVAHVFPSTRGSVTSPITTAQRDVELSMSPCDARSDGSPRGFDDPLDPVPDTITIQFLPAGPGAPPPITVSSYTVDNCSG